MPSRRQIEASIARNRARGLKREDVIPKRQYTQDEIARMARQQRDNPYPPPPRTA